MNWNKYLRFSVLTAAIGSSTLHPALAMTSDYAGTVGKSKVGLNFDSEISTEKGSFQGVYFYASTLKDIPLTAESDGAGGIIIKAKDPAEATEEVFKGNFKKAAADRKPGSAAYVDDLIEGTWTKADQTLPFSLKMEGGVGAEPGHRYAPAGVADDAELEKSVRKFRDAVLAGKKNAVADCIAVPLSAGVDGKFKKIGSRTQFLAAYDKIFTPKFVNAIKESVPHNMFVRDQGVMLGTTGDVWFNAAGEVITLNN